MLFFGLGLVPPPADPVRIELAVDKAMTNSAPTRIGIFFEDINFGADGGLSAELVKNGSFEFAPATLGWKNSGPGTIQVQAEAPKFTNNPNYLRATTGSGNLAIQNVGFRGMGFEKGASYRFTFYARSVEGNTTPVNVELLNEVGRMVGSSTLTLKSKDWTTVETTLSSAATVDRGTLRFTFVKGGTYDIDAVSLMPTKTWKGRRNGLRPDLVQRLADLKPGFMRFPGGCIVEGRDLSNRYQWKNTIGPVEERKSIINRWNVEFASRGKGAEDYFQSFRVGFFEYFQLCEDIGADPLPIINCGMACQYNTGECAPVAELGPYIQDALDLIEFANGPVTSPWGKKRAELGHPKPFGLKALGIGNEQWGPTYFERYPKFAEAIKAKYPEIQLVVSSGPAPSDDKFKYAWEQIRTQGADIVDEHCYANPEWFLNNADRYDGYDRKGPKVFMGEYAAHSAGVGNGQNRNNWACALAEAAYIVGMERNGDVVTMSSYAPLFASTDAWQWAPDLIWFNSRVSYATPSYYVQQLLGRERGDAIVPTAVLNAPVASNGKPRVYASASRDSKSNELIVKVVNATAAPVETALNMQGIAGVKADAKVTQLVEAPEAENDFRMPMRVSPMASTVKVGPSFNVTLPANSVTVYRIALSK